MGLSHLVIMLASTITQSSFVYIKTKKLFYLFKYEESRRGVWVACGSEYKGKCDAWTV